MVSRRAILAASGVGLAAPFILRRSARAGPVRVRRDVMELADADPVFGKYAEAVRAMHALPESDGRNWRRQARIHADRCRHDTLEFLHWHRHYLAFFESICGELIGDPDFALPYWNWSKKGGVIPAPFYDIDALNVEFWNDPGVYSSPNWGDVDTVGRRGLRKGQGLLADPQRGGSFRLSAINDIKRMTSAALFRGRLEGSPHNNGHVVAGATPTGKTGHIGDGLSPLDPIFWLHHGMVDRIWAEWQQAGNLTPDPGTSYAGHFVDRTGAAAPATAGGALQIAAFGYTYDVLQAPASTASTGGSLLGGIVPELERALAEPRAPVLLGGGQNAEPSAALVATTVKVSTPDLAGALATDRVFPESVPGRSPLPRVEGTRILARLSEIEPPQGRADLVVNVFVNCPYLSPTTRYVDPHYAGTFSFFGRGHAGHDQEFLIDITDPVRNLAAEGRLGDGRLTIQLMPLPAYIEGTSEATFKAGRIEIIAV